MRTRRNQGKRVLRALSAAVITTARSIGGIDHSRGARRILIASAALAIPFIRASSAGAAFLSSDAAQFAVLGQLSNNQTNFNNGVISGGDVGIGSPRQFTISNASVLGSIRFSGASNTTGLTPDPDPGSNAGPFTVSGGGTVTGAVAINDPVVTSAINYTNTLGQTLGGRPGTDLTLTSSQTILASSGMLDVDGNRVFDTTSVNLNNATTLTISGSASDYVLINVTDTNPAFNGQIVLTGGITSDHVLFNMFGGNYTTHTGGPVLTISTNGQVTTGIFLDPNGSMQMNNSVLNGRFFGGDVQNQQIVSGANINAPEPTSLAALAFAAAAVLTTRRRRASN
jgi:hypothetical protein